MSELNNVERVLREQGFVVAPVKGDSMLPMLDEKRDAVKIVPVTRTPLEKYDLPLYRRPGGQLVLHRILEVKRRHYVICGDNRRELEKVPHRWVIGVTEGFFKDGKYVPVTDPEYREYLERHCASVKDRTIIGNRPATAKKASLGRRLFPGYYTMVRLYPSLERAPFLLPVMWGARMVKKIFAKLTRGKK